jgi:hypothetical protein
MKKKILTKLVYLADKLDKHGLESYARRLDKIITAAYKGYWHFDDSSLDDASVKEYDKAYNTFHSKAEAKQKEFVELLKKASSALEAPTNNLFEKVKQNKNEQELDEIENYINSPYTIADNMIYDYVDKGKADYTSSQGLLKEDFERYPKQMHESIEKYEKLFGDKYKNEIDSIKQGVVAFEAAINKLPSEEDPPLDWKEQKMPEPEVPGQGKLF